MLTAAVSTTTSGSTPSATIVIKSCDEVAPEHAAPNGANFDIQCSRSYVYFLQNLGLTSGISFTECLNLCSKTSVCDIATYTTYQNFEPDCVLVRNARDGNNIQAFANADAGMLKPRATTITTITTTTTTTASTFITQITMTATSTTQLRRAVMEILVNLAIHVAMGKSISSPWAWNPGFHLPWLMKLIEIVLNVCRCHQQPRPV